MVRTYIRKTTRQTWSIGNMNQALDAVLKSQMGYAAASTRFNVPSSTLERYVKKIRQDPNVTVDKTLGKFRNVFTAEQELELVAYVKDTQKQLFDWTIKDFRRLAYQHAERNNCNHTFNKTLEMAGEDWVRRFSTRHGDLSLRKPEATSGARAMGHNRVDVSIFFTLLKEILDKHKLDASRIFNCDETGITMAPTRFSKVIFTKKQLHRASIVTAQICCSASGTYMPPMLILPGKKKERDIEVGLPPGGWVEVNDSGWMTEDLFLKWFQQFILFSKATKEHPVLLLLDRHLSHTKNLALIDLARDNGVIITCFPSNSLQKLQPLYVAFMKHLSLYYEYEVTKWLKSHPASVVQSFDMPALFGQAYLCATNVTTTAEAFEETGIWPINMNIFTNNDLLQAITTEKPVKKILGELSDVFTAEQELELVTCVKDTQKQLFDWTTSDLRRLAYQLAKRNNCSGHYDQVTEMVGEDWVEGFLKRHGDLGLRKPETIARSRDTDFHRINVSNFFAMLNEVVDKHKLDASRIYNCDETGITMAPERFSRVISTKKQLQSGISYSAHRANIVTAQICCSASGTYMPPMLIFPGKNKPRDVEIPPGAWVEVNDSGWMTEDIFLKWFQQFILFSKATSEQPVLLLLDWRTSFTKNLAVINLAREKGVIMTSFPLYTSQKLQPLYVAFMRHLSLYYEYEATKWVKLHPGSLVQSFDLSALFGQAFLSATNVTTTTEAFEQTGIWPFNLNKFKDDDFLQATTTDTPVKKTLGKLADVFTATQELELVACINDTQKQLFDWTITDLRRLAYQFAERNNCCHNFSEDSEMAGEDWVWGFLKRHDNLSLRKPETISRSQAMDFNRVNVTNFFDLLNDVLDKHELDASRIFNCDETGIAMAPERFSRIISIKQPHQLGVFNYAHRADIVTAQICCSASGTYMPPMLIFPGKEKEPKLEIGLPPGGWVEVNDSGRMTEEIFLKWFQQFVMFSKTTKENPVLLLLDGRVSQSKNLAVIDLARDNGVIIIYFPPDSLQRSQPLYVAFMRHLSLYYEYEVTKWLKSHPLSVVQLFDISALFGQAFLCATNVTTTIEAFETTGIWPCNITACTDDDFLPSTTDNLLQNFSVEIKQEFPSETPTTTLPVVKQEPEALQIDEEVFDEEKPPTSVNEENSVTQVNVFNDYKPWCSSIPDSSIDDANSNVSVSLFESSPQLADQSQDSSTACQQSNNPVQPSFSESTDLNDTQSTSSNSNLIESTLVEGDPTSFQNRNTAKNDDDKLTYEILKLIRDRYKYPRQNITGDRCDIFGKLVAMKLKNLDKKQMFIAEKRINDILYEAEMETLTSELYCQPLVNNHIGDGSQIRLQNLHPNSTHMQTTIDLATRSHSGNATIVGEKSGNSSKEAVTRSTGLCPPDFSGQDDDLNTNEPNTLSLFRYRGDSPLPGSTNEVLDLPFGKSKRRNDEQEEAPDLKRARRMS